MKLEGGEPLWGWLVLLLALEGLPGEVGEVWPSVEELLLPLAAALVVKLPESVACFNMLIYYFLYHYCYLPSSSSSEKRYPSKLSLLSSDASPAM